MIVYSFCVSLVEDEYGEVYLQLSHLLLTTYPCLEIEFK